MTPEHSDFRSDETFFGTFSALRESGERSVRWRGRVIHCSVKGKSLIVRVQLPEAPGGGMRIAHRRPWVRFLSLLRLTRRVRPADRSFDRDYDVFSATPEFADLFTDHPVRHKAIDQLMAFGSMLRVDGGYVEVERRGVVQGAWHSIDHELAAVADALVTLVERMPAGDGKPVAPAWGASGMRVDLAPFLALWPLFMIVPTIIFFCENDVVNPWQAAYVALPYSLASIPVSSLTQWLLFRGAALHVGLILFVMAGTCFFPPFLTFSLLKHLNHDLDKKPPIERIEQTVIRIVRAGRGRSRHYQFDLSPPKKKSRFARRTVKDLSHQDVEPGETIIETYVRPGYFGLPWRSPPRLVEPH